MQRDIRQQWFFNHAPERVWAFLTTPELISKWLMENNFRPVVGHQFQFKTKPRRGFDGNVYCEVLAVEPNKFLSYSWKGGPEKGNITLDTVVSWTLVEKNGGTELTLEQKGFKGLNNYLAYVFMNLGWKGKIKRRLEELLSLAEKGV